MECHANWLEYEKMYDTPICMTRNEVEKCGVKCLSTSQNIWGIHLIRLFERTDGLRFGRYRFL